MLPLLALGAVIIALVTPFPAYAVGPNLVPNPSLEDESAGAPIGWSTGTYGAAVPPVFTYPVEGSGGPSTKAARIDKPDVAGDAKWYFNYLNVSSSTDYVYRDRYRSNVPTRVVVAEGDASGTFTYTEALASVPASPASWGDMAIEIHTKPTTAWLSIYHLIEHVGWLTVDDASLEVDDPISYVDGIPNNSVERVSAVNSSMPRAWYPSSWANPGDVVNATFEYLSGDGHEGSRSVKVAVADYISGDAKWLYTPQPLTQGADYRFTAWYKTDAVSVPRVVARFLNASGAESFFGMPNPMPSGGAEWQLYTGEFSVPLDAVGVNVFFLLRGNGWVQADDYHITPYAYEAFDRPLITLTFDDGAEDNNVTALPVLDGYGFKSTQCYATEHYEGIPAQEALITQFFNSGHEICAHTITHRSLVTLPEPDLLEELAHPQEFLETLTGAPVTSFASPYGDYNPFVLSKIDDYYATHRTVDEGYNSPDNLDLYRLRVQNMKKGTTLAQFQAWVNKAIADKTWLILVYHRVSPDEGSLGEFDTLKANFDAEMAWLKGRVDAGDIAVKRMDAAIEEITAVPPAVTTTTISNAAALATPTVAGEGYKVKWSVVAASGTPTGTVAVLADGSPACSAAVAAEGCIVTSTAAGTVELTASYSGSEGFAPSTSTIVLHPVVGVNYPPVITGPTFASTTIGVPLTFMLSIIDPNGDPVYVTIALPEGAVFSTSTGEFFWTPSTIGTSTATFWATDGQATTTHEVALQVAAAPIVPPSGGGGGGGGGGGNASPYFVNFAPSTTTTAQVPYLYQVLAVDPEKDPITFSLSGAPSGMTINPTSGLIGWTPAIGQVSSTPYHVTVRVQTTKNAAVGVSYDLLVLAPAPGAPSGEVLGVSTTAPVCIPYLTTNLFPGVRGDEVKKLQVFLNEVESAKIPVTGYFGPLTKNAVNSFQKKYADRILTPLGLKKPTGNVAGMTRQVINELWCERSEKSVPSGSGASAPSSELQSLLDQLNALQAMLDSLQG